MLLPGTRRLYDAAAALDEKGVSGDGRVAVLNPRQYYALIKGLDGSGIGAYLVNRDSQGDALQSGKGIYEIAGIKIYKSMNVPFFGEYGTKLGGTAGAEVPGLPAVGNLGSFVQQSVEDARNSVTGINNEYGQQADYTKSCGIIFQKEGAGVVEAIGPQVQVTSGDVSVIYQGDVILGRLAMGADYLNPAACVELYAGHADGNAAF